MCDLTFHASWFSFPFVFSQVYENQGQYNADPLISTLAKEYLHDLELACKLFGYTTDATREICKRDRNILVKMYKRYGEGVRVSFIVE